MLDEEGETEEIKELYKDWINQILFDFIPLFGENFVPMDVKWAMNVTEKGLGLNVTKWRKEYPPNLFEDTPSKIKVPMNVFDELKRKIK